MANPVDAPDFRSGGLNVTGAIQIDAFSNVARFGNGFTSLSDLGNLPANIFLGNLYNFVAPMNAFDAALVAGTNISYSLATSHGPTPQVVFQGAQTYATAGTAFTIVLPDQVLPRDRVVVATYANGASQAWSTPFPWTTLTADSSTAGYTKFVEYIYDGSTNDPASLPITLAVSSSLQVYVWHIRQSSATTHGQTSVHITSAGTSNDIPAITPTWGIANNLYLVFIGIEIDAGPPNVTAFPTGFTNTDQQQIVSGTANIDGAIAWGQTTDRGLTFDPTAFTYASSANSIATLIGIPPESSGALDWDGVNVRKNSGGSLFVRPQLNLIEGTGITLTVADDAINNEVDITITASGGAGSQGWDDVLLIDAHSGATNPIVDPSQYLQFNTTTVPVTGQIRTGSPFEIRGTKNINLTALEAINIVGHDQVLLQSTAGATVVQSSSVDPVQITAGTIVEILSGYLTEVEQAASTPTVVAGEGMWWVRNDTPNVAMFTDDTNVDHRLCYAPVSLLDMAVQATDTFLANVSGGTASPTAVNLSTLAGAGLVFGTHTLDVTAGAGASIVVTANDVQRGALTGAITASQDSNTTAFGTLAAKSVLANATNATAVPAALAGSAAFQHLRVNSGNTGLEWSVLTSGDFPAASVPITALATTATDTFIANVSGSTATPTAVNISTLAGAGLVFGTHTLDVTAGAGASLVVSANDIQRGALTGAITASQDSNTTAFGTLAAKSVLANATNATAVPAALAGSAAFQHLRVNSGNTGLEWSVLTSGDFPAGTVPLTGMATQAAHTFVANNTAGVASPIAITGTAATAELDVFTSTLKGLAPLSGGGTANFLRADGTWTTPPGTTTTAHIIQDNSTARTQRANLNFDSTTSIVAAATDDLANNQTDVTMQRAALTGAVTAAQNSNATAFGVLAALSVLANATNASAVPAALAGSAAFQHLRVNSAGTGLEWSVFTTGDFPAASVPITGLATTATDTFLANVTVGTATPTAVNISTLAGAGLVFGTHTLDVTAGAGASLVVSANDIQRGALTGAITASQDSNTTAFGTLAAKSVLANATNATAVPAALAGSAAFQHLRVNSGNTGLEWSVLTSGDFPAGTVPLTGMATQAAHTFVANNTAGTASPIAITGTAATAELDVFTSTLKGLAPLSGGGTTNFLRADGTWAAPAAAAAGHTIQDNSTARTQRGNLNFDSTTSIIAAATDDSVNNQTDITMQRAALTGDVTATQNSNATTIANNVVTNAKLTTVATAILKGRTTALTGNVEDLTLTNATTNTWNTATGGTISIERAALTGDVTASANSNATTIAANTVTDAKLRQGAALTVVGRSANTTGNVADIAAVAASGAVLRESGSTIGFGTIATAGIANNAVDNTKLAQVATARLKGRTTAATGNVEDLTLTNSTSVTWNVATGGTISVERAALTGDVTATANSNATTIATNAVTDTKLRQGAALTVIGRSANTTGNVADIAATAATGFVLRESSSVLGFGTVDTSGITANAITDTRLRQGTGLSVIGRPTSTTGNVSDISTTTSSAAVLREASGVLGFGQVATAGIANNAVDDTKLRSAAALSVVGRSANSTGNVADIIVAGTRIMGQHLRVSQDSNNVLEWYDPIQSPILLWDDFVACDKSGFAASVGLTQFNTGVNTWNIQALGHAGIIGVLQTGGTQPGVLKFSSGAVAADELWIFLTDTNNAGGIALFGSVSSIQRTTIIVAMSAPATGVYAQFGLSDSRGTSTAHIVAFYISGSTTLHAICQNGSVPATTDVNLGVALAAVTRLEIVTTSGAALFYVDGSLKTTILTNVPSASMGICLGMILTSSVSHDMFVDCVQVIGKVTR